MQRGNDYVDRKSQSVFQDLRHRGPHPGVRCFQCYGGPGRPGGGLRGGPHRQDPVLHGGRRAHPDRGRRRRQGGQPQVQAAVRHQGQDAHRRRGLRPGGPRGGRGVPLCGQPGGQGLPGQVPQAVRDGVPRGGQQQFGHRADHPRAGALLRLHRLGGRLQGLAACRGLRGWSPSPCWAPPPPCPCPTGP